MFSELYRQIWSVSGTPGTAFVGPGSGHVNWDERKCGGKGTRGGRNPRVWCNRSFEAIFHETTGMWPVRGVCRPRRGTPGRMESKTGASCTFLGLHR